MLSMADTTSLTSPHVPATENVMSRRYLRMLEKWVPVGMEYFEEWPGRPDCGHFLGGVHWYGNETIGPTEAFVAASVSPEYDEHASGVSRDVLRRTAVKAIRYLCFTHDTGPTDCVRPATGLGRPENRGKKWGERGRGFFPESQCGTGIAMLAVAALLLREELDEETWLMVARIHEDYAQRFGELQPKSGVYLDTQMEENAWTAAGLNSCSLFLENHESAEKLEEMARRWMFSTCAVPQDAKDGGTLGGTPVRSLAGKTFTALPDYWAENHGMVHPNYTSSGVCSLLTLGCQLKLWGRDLPEELLWNRRRVYEGIKALTDGAGYAQAVQGMDWHYLPAVGAETAHAVASVLLGDPDAAALQRRGLRSSELRQEGNGGRLYDRDFAERAHDQQDPMIMREAMIRSVARLYLLHRLFGPGPDPTPEDKLERRLRGMRVFPHAGFVHHRHERGQTSVSWRNSVMALPLTRDGIYTVAPCSDTWLGRPTVRERPDSHRPVSVRVAEGDDAFATALVMDRCQESLRQEALLASLPDGRLLSWERFVALEDLAVAQLDQGFLRITNETFPRLGLNSRGHRTLYRPDGATDYEGRLADSPEADRVDRLGTPGWLNIDDRMGIRFLGPGAAVYHNRRFHKPYRAIADDLTLSRHECALRRGEASAPFVALLVPEQSHTETPGSGLSLLQGPEGAACIATDGYVAAANFAPASRTCAFTGPGSQVVPVYPGARVEARGEGVTIEVRIAGRHAVLLRAARTVKVSGDVRIDALAQDAVYVVNIGERQAVAEVTQDDGPALRLDLSPGEIGRLD